MKDTTLNTVAGSIFTLIVMSPTQILTIIITGALGAVGAFIGSVIIKWVSDQALKLYDRIKAGWKK